MLALVKDQTGPAMWRIWQPLAALQKAGYPADWDYTTTPLLDQIAPHYDGYVLARMSWHGQHRKTAEAWFDRIHLEGKFVVFECDDDLFTRAETERRIDLGETKGLTFEQLEAERAERIWAMTQCDGVTVTTEHLAGIVRSFTEKPVIVVPNAIDLPWFRGVLRGAERQIQAPTIGWAGGKRHDRDLEAVASAWGRIAARMPGVTFVVQGHLPACLQRAVPADRLKWIPWMRLETYPLGLAQVDVACCSVADTPFNRAKTAIKAMEAAAAGSAVVATPALYGEILEHGYSGFLAETVDEWEAHLVDLVERPAVRAMLARRLLRVVERRCSLRENLANWPRAWKTIAEAARARRGRLVAV